MSKRLLFSFVAGAFALAVGACVAAASPLNRLADLKSDGAYGLLIPAHAGGGGHGGGFGGGMHGGGIYGGAVGGFHGAYFSGGHIAGRSRIRAQSLTLANSTRSRDFHYGHSHIHHHRHRIFIGGYPYFYFDDGDYDDGGDCWWSGHYHRWVCQDY
jgi:hypothetical protein